jgi:murein DD-endopeptidase MepM/ murein hydrolase activator NlpD
MESFRRRLAWAIALMCACAPFALRADAAAAAVSVLKAEAAPAFGWPVEGPVMARRPGHDTDGITIAVPEGSAIRAAADGVVAYAGTELKGYGTVVFVRHAAGFVTAYAFAKNALVKRGDAVRRGDPIALSGSAGGTGQVRFEIRKGATPVVRS